MSSKAGNSSGNQRRRRTKKSVAGSGGASDSVSSAHASNNNPNRNQFFDSNITGSSSSGKKYARQDFAKKLHYKSSGKHGANTNAHDAGSHPSNTRYSGEKGSANFDLMPTRKKQILLNGEKGAEAYTVSESDRIKFTELLIDFRENEKMNELQLPSDLTNTERKFLHLLAGQLGLKSKSTGKGENRFITVTRPDSNQRRKAARNGSNSDSGLPVLNVGTDGIKQLKNYISRYPPTEVERFESTLTGSSLDQNSTKGESLLQALNELGISTSEPISLSKSGKNINLAKRIELHKKRQDLRMRNKEYEFFTSSRAKLPAFKFADIIASTVLEHQVVVISGATGCGKSTQVPQFLLDDPRIGSTASIAVTQPRRISAISLCERVAAERCEKAGNVVGYQVRLESETSSATQCLFLTPGILLRRLLSDPLLSEFTHIIIDEIHERDKYTEFLLITLRDLLQKRPELRIICMSATLQIQLLVDYFCSSDGVPPPEISIPGRTFPVQHFFLEDILRMTGYESEYCEGEMDKLEENITVLLSGKGRSDTFNKLSCVMCGKAGFLCPEELGTHVALCNGGGDFSMTELEQIVLDSKDAVGLDVFNDRLTNDDDKDDDDYIISMNEEEIDIFEDEDENKWYGDGLFVGVSLEKQTSLGDDELLKRYQSSRDDEEIDYDLLTDIVKYIDESSYGSGAILVFLPGWQEISETDLILKSISPFNNNQKYMILPLHSGIPSKDQRKCFAHPPNGVRKIILATNIAETSVTIDDVAFVVDTGRMKEKSYDPHLKTSTLQPVWISAASAKQRAGRAGRTKAGVTFRLFSKNRFESFNKFQESEFLRTPLEEICLQCKKLGVAPGGPEDIDGIPAFLGKALTPPHPKSIENAMQILIDLGAMNCDTNELTDLGHHLAGLSLEPRVGKMVVWSYLLGCVRRAVVAGVSMAYKSPFIVPPRHLVKYSDSARISLSEGSESDQIMVINSLTLFEKALLRGTSSAHGFCSSNYLSFPTMKMISDIRKSITRELQSMGFPDPNLNGYYNRFGKNDQALLQAAICAGLYPNIATRQKGEINFSTMSNRKAKVHVSSVNGCRGQPLATKCSIRKDDIEIVVFGELVRGVNMFTMNQTTHLFSPLPILLLCGELRIRPSVCEESSERKNTSVLSVDDWICFQCSTEIASNLVVLRRRTQEVFLKFVSKGVDSFSRADIDALDMLGSVLKSCHNEYI